MEDPTLIHYLKHIGSALAKLILIALVLPLLLVSISGQSVPAAFALMTSTLVIEYGAAPVGIGLGLNPLIVLLTMACIALGVSLFLYDLLDATGRHSERVALFLKKTEDRARQSQVLSRYGIYGLVPCVLILGFYVSTPVSWIFGWNRNRSLLLIMAGYVAASVVTVSLSIGFFGLLSGLEGSS
jgi:uncharacterized membrane protein